MAWHEISPGHFQRVIGENETFIKMIGDSGQALKREHWAINADASFHLSRSAPTEQLVKRFENAWKALRFEHPSIAAIAGVDHIDYTVPNVGALQDWCSETFVVHDGETTLASVVASHQPSPYVLLHLFPGSKELLLHTSHWRTDGIGILQLLNAFFELAGSDALPDSSTLAWGEETSRLCPSIEEAAGLAKEPTASIKAEAEKWTKTFHDVPDGIGILCPAGPETLPGATHSARRTFSKQTTEAIILACKTHNISVTSAVHAALAITNYSFAAPPLHSKPYVSTIRAALRPYLPTPFHTPTFASGLYTSGYMYSLPPGQPFTHYAKLLNEQYRQGLSAAFLASHRQYALNLQELIANPAADAKPSSEIDISSVGVLNDIVATTHGSLEIQSVGVGVEILTRQMVCFAWTFRGQLSLNLVYNAAFHDAAVPAACVEELQRVLCRELAVPG